MYFTGTVLIFATSRYAYREKNIYRDARRAGNKGILLPLGDIILGSRYDMLSCSIYFVTNTIFIEQLTISLL